MPVSPLDALMQIATPPRVAEPLARTGGGEPFGSALQQAYQTDSSRSQPTPAAEAPATPAAAEQAPTADDGNSDESTASEEEAAAALVEQTVELEEAAEEEQDAAEISAAGAAAAEAMVAKGEEGNVVASVGNKSETPTEENANAKQASTDKPTTESEPPTSLTKASCAEAAEASALSPLSSAAKEQHGDHEPKERESTDASPSVDKNEQPQVTNEKRNDATQTVALNTAAADQHKEDAGPKRPAETLNHSKSTDTDVGESHENATKPTVVHVEASMSPEPVVAAVSAATNDSPTNEAADKSPPSPVVVALDSGTRATAAIDRLMAGRSLRTGKESGEADSTPPVDRARFVQRVEGAVKAAQQRDGKIQVRLSPPELGHLRIELVVQNGVMTAKLEAETPAARMVLLDNLPALRERLAQQDIRVEKFDVDVRRDSGGNAGHGPHDRPTDQSETGRQAVRSKPTAPRAVMVAPPPGAVAAMAASDAGLDVRI